MNVTPLEAISHFLMYNNQWYQQGERAKFWAGRDITRFNLELSNNVW
jgi:hypothetical protein